MPRNILTRQIEIKRSMVAAVSGLPRLVAAMGELSRAVEHASQPTATIDDDTARECALAVEQMAYALETTAADLRAHSAPIATPWLVRMGSFWKQFETSLYDAGYSDVVESCGATNPQSRQDATIACAFIVGAAQMARLANAYNGFHWRVAQIMACAAATTLSMLRDQTMSDSDVDEQFSRLAHTWTDEVNAEIRAQITANVETSHSNAVAQ